jgi:4-amino-4-deoxy-L-arabinose transferase-like glycosyltransferase
VPLAVLIVAPWIVAVEAATGGAFLREAIGTHVVSRSVSAFESHGFFPGFYLVTAPLVAFPWFGFLFGAVWGRLVSAANGLVGDRSFRFLAAWLVGPWLVLELVQTKLVHYWMPSYPAGILLVVGWVVAVRGTGAGFGLPTRLLVLAAGLVVALVPTVITLYLGVARLWPSAAAATLILAGGTIAAVVMAGRTPWRAMWTLAAGTAVFLAVLFGLFVPDLATDSIPPLAGRRASELVGPDERVVVFKPRDDDLFFYLPVDSAACENAGCLDALWRDGAQFLALTRNHDFEVLNGEWPGVDLVEIDRVEGIDLNRVERAEVVIFRVQDLP